MQVFYKKISLFFISLLLFLNILNAQYCVPPVTGSGVFAKITGVSFAGYALVSPACGTGRYNIISTNTTLFKGQTFMLKTKLSRCGNGAIAPYSTTITYIDWNSDQDFNDVGEMIGSHYSVYFESEVFDIITVPDIVVAGIESRIRIIADDNVSTDLAACAGHSHTIDLQIAFINPPLYPEKPLPLGARNKRARSIQIEWTDNANAESGYRVERSTDSLLFSTIAELPANTIVYKDSTLSPGTKYFYRVNEITNHPDSASIISFSSLTADFKWEKDQFPISIDGTGAFWNDIDKNGKKDIFISSSSQSPIDGILHGLWINNNSNFTQSSEDFRICSGVTWIDFDNDGDDDLYASSELYSPNGFGQSYMYENNGDGTFTRMSPFTPDGAIFSTSWSDYNNDGYIDVFVNYQGTTGDKLYKNNRDKTFSFVRSFGFLSNPASFVDYDDDGDDDVVTLGQTKSVFVRQDSVFTLLPTNPFLPYNSQYRGVSWGDFDNNGKPDVYVANDQSAVSSLYMNMGNGIFTHSTLDGGVFGSAIADYDNDGFEDLFISRFEKQSILYKNDKEGHLVPVSREVFINEEDSIAPFGAFTAFGASWADFNNDGFPDLFQSVRNFDKQSRLYSNQKNNNNWIHFNLTGTASNKNAIGARIRIKSGGKWQYRWIQSNSGMAGQNDYTVEFGLGNTTLVDSLEIRWPLGDNQVITNPAINQVHDIFEPAITAVLWIGSTDTNWHNPLNWNTGNIPDAFANVVINPGTPFTCTISSSAVCRTLKLISGATIVTNANFEIRK